MPAHDVRRQAHLADERMLEIQAHAFRLLRSNRFTAKEIVQEIRQAFPEVPEDVRKSALRTLADQLMKNY